MDQLPPGTDLCQIPAGMPPGDHVPNFINPVNLEAETLTVGSVFLGISAIMVALRMYGNRHKMKAADWLTIVGFALGCAYTGVTFALRKYARHQYDMPACWYVEDSIWILLFASNLLLGPTQFFVKVAILVLFFQLFAINRKTRWAIHAGIAFSAILYLLHPILIIVFQTPRAGERWADLATNGRPQHMTPYGPFHGIGSPILDTYILIVPLIIVGKLKVPTKKRVQLMAVFGIGILGIIASIFACYWRFEIFLSDDVYSDYTWLQGQLFIWIMVEHDAALIAGSMPAVAALIRTSSTSGHGPFSSLRSLISRRRDYGSSSGYPKNMSEPESTGPRSRDQYRELDELPLRGMQTDVSAAEMGGHAGDWEQAKAGGIMRTTAVTQTQTQQRGQAF